MGKCNRISLSGSNGSSGLSLDGGGFGGGGGGGGGSAANLIDMAELIKTVINPDYLEGFIDANTDAEYAIIKDRIYTNKFVNNPELDYDVYIQKFTDYKNTGTLNNIDVFAQLALNALGVLKKGYDKHSTAVSLQNEVNILNQQIAASSSEENRGILITTQNSLSGDLDAVYLEYILTYGYPESGIFDPALLEEFS